MPTALGSTFPLHWHRWQGWGSPESPSGSPKKPSSQISQRRPGKEGRAWRSGHEDRRAAGSTRSEGGHAPNQASPGAPRGTGRGLRGHDDLERGPAWPSAGRAVSGKPPCSSELGLLKCKVGQWWQPPRRTAGRAGRGPRCRAPGIVPGTRLNARELCGCRRPFAVIAVGIRPPSPLPASAPRPPPAPLSATALTGILALGSRRPHRPRDRHHPPPQHRPPFRPRPPSTSIVPIVTPTLPLHLPRHHLAVSPSPSWSPSRSPSSPSPSPPPPSGRGFLVRGSRPLSSFRFSRFQNFL